MRFKISKPKRWDRRTVKRFAFLPVFLSPIKESNKKEIRWLEFVTLEQEYFGGHWFNEAFIDKGVAND